MVNQTAGVWIQAADGDLVRADAIIMLRCQDGVVTGILAAGQVLRLVGPGCPPDFHHQLLAEIAESRLLDGDRHTVIITVYADRDQLVWEWSTARLSSATRDDQSAQRYAPSPRAALPRAN